MEGEGNEINTRKGSKNFLTLIFVPEAFLRRPGASLRRPGMSLDVLERSGHIGVSLDPPGFLADKHICYEPKVFDKSIEYFCSI